MQWTIWELLKGIQQLDAMWTPENNWALALHVKALLSTPQLEGRDFGAERLRALETHHSQVDVTYHGAETPRGWDSVIA